MYIYTYMYEGDGAGYPDGVCRAGSEGDGRWRGGGDIIYQHVFLSAYASPTKKIPD